VPVYSRLALIALLGAVACVFGACGSKEEQEVAQHQPSAPRHSPGLPLSKGDIDCLISKALRVYVTGDSVLAREDTILVLSTLRIYHPPDSSIAQSFTQAALPRSLDPEFVLLSPQQAAEMRASSDLHYLEIQSISVSGDEATVAVVYWSVPSRAHVDAGHFASAEGPMVVFRRVGGDWTFVNAAMWQSVN
jgi:hypothetical protein